MADDLVDIAETRERVRELLAQRYAEGILDLESYEARVDAAEGAEALAPLRALIADLRPGDALSAPSRALALPRAGALAVPETRPRGAVTSVFGSTTRSGAWELPRRLDVRAVFGEAVLDLREARIAAGTSEIHVTSVFGSVEVIAPPGLRVLVEGTPILGEFSGREEPSGADPSAPRVVIRGVAVFGSVEVEHRRVGESARDARRRRKAERKALRQEARRQLPGA